VSIPRAAVRFTHKGGYKAWIGGDEWLTLSHQRAKIFHLFCYPGNLKGYFEKYRRMGNGGR
jgi:hypothetical protein